jgi:hypothetical protein
MGHPGQLVNDLRVPGYLYKDKGKGAGVVMRVQKKCERVRKCESAQESVRVSESMKSFRAELADFEGGEVLDRLASGLGMKRFDLKSGKCARVCVCVCKSTQFYFVAGSAAPPHKEECVCIHTLLP